MTPSMLQRAPGRDELLRTLLQILAARGIARRWAESETPRSDLERECTAIVATREIVEQLARYLGANPVISLSVETFLAHLSVGANLRAEHVPVPQRMLVPLGTRIARWLPTLLVVDGPLGRLLRASDSPLSQLLRTEHTRYPCLASARDAFNHDLFRRVRNGVGHWAFSWEQGAGEQRLVCYDHVTGERSAEVSLLEAEALHVVSFAVVECLDEKVLKAVHGAGRFEHSDESIADSSKARQRT